MLQLKKYLWFFVLIRFSANAEQEPRDSIEPRIQIILNPTEDDEWCRDYFRRTLTPHGPKINFGPICQNILKQTRFDSGMTAEQYYRKYDNHRNKTSLRLCEEKLIKETVLDLQAALNRSIEQRHLGTKFDLSFFDIRIDALPQRCEVHDVPRNCDEATACTRRSGFYQIKLNRYTKESNSGGYTNVSIPSILVECVIDADNGTWTIIQRRQDGSVDFYRGWDDYQTGFGDVEGEFFIGLDNLHVLTNFQGPQELMIRMENYDGKTVTPAYARYDSFAIGSYSDKYVLKRIGKYSGTAGDSLQHHVGHQFSTKDQDNDNCSNSTNCAQEYTGAWWYNSYQHSNLNGQYGNVTDSKGINWKTLSGYNVSLKYVEMRIRRRRN